MKIFSFTYLISLVSLMSCFAQNNPDFNPADKKATPETQAVYKNMKQLSGKGIMFGHHDDLAYGVGWKSEKGRSDVQSVCGDYPAVFGWDFSHIELGEQNDIDSVRFDVMRNYIREVYSLGGVNVVSWHLDNPLTGGNAWDITSTNVVSSILPGGTRHELYKQRLDRLADYMLSLRDEHGKLIPILFRPFHEHTGSWFWWGRNLCTTKEYTDMFRFTVNYLRNARNVHNLIITYSPDRVKNREEYMERYPGDDVVDVFGIDIYCWKNDSAVQEYQNAVKTGLTIITNLAKEKNKLSAFTETGLEGITNDKWWTDVLWKAIGDFNISYVLVWRNAFDKPGHFYAPYPGHSSAKDFQEFYGFPKTFFAKDVLQEKLYQ